MHMWALHSQFQTAVQFNDLTTIKYLLSNGLDCDVRLGTNNTPALCLASKSGNLEVVRLLVNNGCSVNQADMSGQTALHFACSNMFLEIARILIANRANLNTANSYGCTPLHLAVQNNSLALVKLVVESGASLEKLDHSGQTALLLACKRDHTEIVQYLLAKGANVEATDLEGNTPLLCAISAGLRINTFLVKLLLNAGASPDQANKLGLTPLLTAIRRSSDHLEDGCNTVEALIEYNCNLNTQDCLPPFHGETALNIAITRNQDNITAKLVRAGADTTRISTNGQSPLVRLIKEHKTDLAKLVAASSRSISLADLRHLEAERNTLSELDGELYNYIYQEENFFPRLRHLSRSTIRMWLGRRADSVIQTIPLPYTLKRYLLLCELF